MAALSHEILIVGLGAAARTHLTVLEQISGTEVSAGVDLAALSGLTFRGRAVPVYKTVKDAGDRHDPGVVIVATPTPTHAAVCAEVADTFPAAKILVEKPAADNLADASRVLTEIGSAANFVTVDSQ